MFVDHVVNGSVQTRSEVPPFSCLVDRWRSSPTDKAFAPEDPFVSRVYAASGGFDQNAKVVGVIPKHNYVAC